MRIIEIKHIEDCFDGTYLKELLFSDFITAEEIFLLGKYGKLQYFKDFARPFFKVIFRNDFYIKGVQGNNTARVFITQSTDLDFLVQLFNK